MITRGVHGDLPVHCNHDRTFHHNPNQRELDRHQEGPKRATPDQHRRIRGSCPGRLRQGIWRSTDKGKTWKAANEGLAIPYVRWIATSPKQLALILAGTEPAGIFVSNDAGDSWNINPAVLKLRDANGWFLPYSPRSGCVRGFAFAESGPNKGRIYAAVEVGGVLVSDDNGRSWQLAAGSDGKPEMNRELGTMIHPDVHSITVHPSSSDIVTAATGGGLFRSIDAGRSWKNIYPCYIRAVWVDPIDHQHLVAGPADGVSRNGRIEESRDGGRSWHSASIGLKAPWSRHMVERFAQVDDELFAVLSNGELWSRKAERPELESSSSGNRPDKGHCRQ